jgi:hypothetical protein
MSISKIDRALYGPSMFEVTLGAVLSILLGLALGTIFLVLKPVVVAAEMPKEEERIQGAVYYLEGKADASRGKQWHRKRQLLMEGTPGEIAFSEEELNAWFSSGAPKKPAKKPAAPPKPGAPPAPEEEIPSELLTLETPNVRIRDGVFQVGVPGQLNLITFSLPVVVQTRGKFAKTGDMWSYQPDEVFVGSMPLHRIPGVTKALSDRLMRTSLIPEDGLAAWKKVANVTLDGKQLKLVIE